jgi:outer membrane receptor for ferrienterochelin and colicins
MKNFRNKFFLFLLLLSSYFTFAQGGGTVKVTGKVIEKDTKLPLEFANIAFFDTANTVVNGGLTDANGEFSFDVKPGTYTIRIEFISFKPVSFSRDITSDTNLGITSLEVDVTQLEAVEIIAERTTVDIKLDKRVYTVGQDMMVKGGTISDVLDNVPSVSVDAEGNVALRGNEGVTVLIDGRPSSLSGGNIADILRQLPAESVDKVEVITNPSARYDAEGGGGIINIVLKKGKADGFNGSVTANTGIPENHGINGNLNFRSEKFNLFSNFGYQYRRNPGNSFTDTEYLDEAGNTEGFVNEHRENERFQRGFNASFGIELFLDESLSWTNSFNFRRSNGDNPTDTWYDNYLADGTFESTRYRYNFEDEKDNNVQFSTSLLKKFNEDGHELKIDASAAMNLDDENAIINDVVLGSVDPDDYSFERTFNKEKENRTLVQADYVLPISENSRFEAGYRGSFNERVTDARAESLEGGAWQNDENYTNELEYNEYVNALYTQYGSKVGKFSYLFGLRWEDTNIDVNLLNRGEYNNKKYNNFFPSAFLTYEFNESTNISLSYSRRINRPRGRFLNPFSGLESNINIFQGNPDLDPSLTDAIDLGFLKKWRQVTLSTSSYLNITDDSFQFVRRIEDREINGTIFPVTISSPINLAKEYRFGFEFNVNYNPFKWWRLNTNFNFFRNETQGDYTFTYINNDDVVVNDFQNFDNTAYSWTARVNSKITLPGKIDWQLNANYNAPQERAQGRSRGVASANTALSKDILKDKATIALNVQDIFNSRKMKNETFIPGELRSYSEMQWRERQITLSFTYRFNMTKSDRQKEQQQQRNQQQDNGDEMMGG